MLKAKISSFRSLFDQVVALFTGLQLSVFQDFRGVKQCIFLNQAG